jgi:CTP:molybdopterin cytidylyltransferase MocA
MASERAPRMKVACAVLAAGGSTRMGSPKQLLVIDGRPLIARVLDAAAFIPDVAVVLGARADEVARAVGGAQILHNPRWPEGMSTSLHTAVSWAQGLHADGLLLCTCDQALLDRAHLEHLRAEFERTRQTVASRYEGALAVPALIEARHFAQLLEIDGDRGAGPLLRSGIPITAVEWPEGAVDLDTPDDVARFNSRA